MKAPFMPRHSGAKLTLLATALVVATMGTTATLSSDPSTPQSSGAALTRAEARKLKSPVSYSKASIARGKILYARACTECHGANGKSQVDVIADATDLTNPKAWRSGTSEGEIFRSIRDGAGEAMPPFAEKVTKQEDLWHLVNYLRSLWPASAQPKLLDSASH
jgi:mono/diheme cytochrome c family protein